MKENHMNSEDRASEEVDVEPYEGAPDFEDSPTKQHYGEDLPTQEEVEQGQPLGDDLETPEKKETPDA